ncbi:type II secretion system protein [Ensifer sp. ENS06]|uniref:type IV pilus modification PilV family protein n=1 Tax=Ensifer sp. ENS06 TaxID=2769276 RepID=UPI00178477D8|nr:type II secretion system protein [Ensifer sp. ENS06]MBD9624006.1 type II secretion system protein [Ensifer sp. ENS06]
MHACDLSDDTGFTLLEMIAAFVILSSSLVIATQAIGLASRGAVAADERETALELLQDIRTLELSTVSGQISDPKGRLWKVSIRKPRGEALSNLSVSAMSLTSPGGIRFGFLLPDSGSERNEASGAR